MVLSKMTKTFRFDDSPPTEHESMLYSVEGIMDAVWYSSSEMEAILQRCKLVATGQLQDVDSLGFSSCLRGLELVSEGKNQRKRHQSIVDGILAEQARQIHETGVADTESLGQFARAACSHRQRLAEMRGMQDAMEASNSGNAWTVGTCIRTVMATPKPSSTSQQGGRVRREDRRQARRRMNGRTRPQPGRTASGGRSIKREK